LKALKDAQAHISTLADIQVARLEQIEGPLNLADISVCDLTSGKFRNLFIFAEASDFKNGQR
jgi:hypothetical protein